MIGNVYGVGSGTSAAAAAAYVASQWSGVIFGFAMAEFLIINDLSAVVDVPTPMSDCHTNLIGGHAGAFVPSYILYLDLINSLKNLMTWATAAPCGSHDDDPADGF